MKKLIAILLAIVMMVALVACGKPAAPQLKKHLPVQKVNPKSLKSATSAI